MPSVTNTRLLFREIPTGLPDPQTVFECNTSEKIDLDNFDIQGGILVKVLALSLDPYMRNRMRPADTEGDMPAFQLGQVYVV